MRRIALLVSLLVLAGASPARGATTFGANLATGSAGVVFPAGTFLSSVTFTSGESGTADGVLSLLTLKEDGTSAVAPVDGILTSFSMRMADPVSGNLRLVFDRGTGTAPLIGYGRSGTVNVPGDGAIHTFPVRLPIVAGSYIGFVTPLAGTTVVWRDATTRSLRMLTDYAEDNRGMSEATLNSVFKFQTPLSGTIEPDADKDGFGDESQDACPGVAGTDGGCVPKPTPPSGGGGDQGGSGTTGGGGDQSGSGPTGGTVPPPSQPAAPPPDVVAPLLSSFVLAPASFVAANTGAGVVAAKKVGTTVVYKLSEKATATFAVDQKVTGVKKGKKCVAGRPGHGKKKCTRVVVLGSFTQSGASGLNSFKFMGRLGNKALKKGSYELVATATDAAGNKSKSALRPFKIVG